MPDDPRQPRLYPLIDTLDLSTLCGSERFKLLDKYESYHAGTQYEGRKYDWNGALRAFAGGGFEPSWYVPLSQRKPSARYDLPKLIVGRLTAMVFGEDRFPQFVIEQDEDAQDYVRELARESLLMRAAMELRNNGGAQGTACASFGFVEGKPRVYVHNAKHVTVLRWADRYEMRPAEVLKAYSYPREVYDSNTGRTVTKTYYFAQYWNEQVERIWDPIPEEAARNRTWMNLKSSDVTHGFGFCPVYWVQNVAKSDNVDGLSDFEGQFDKCDEINILQSSTSRGTVANVDPTLVIKDDPNNNPGKIAKGSGRTIWSKGGAEYLELRGESLKAALLLFAEMKQQVLDTTGVVLGDPQMTAKAQSAAAMRMLYLPMINEADIRRAQYGRFLTQLMKGMLQAAKAIGTGPAGAIITTQDGHRLQMVPTVQLEPRWVDAEPREPDADPDPKVPKQKPKKVKKPRVPGESEAITLNWPPYFPNTWTDTKMAADALTTATGQGVPIISQKTAVENLAPIMGIADVEQELQEIQNDTAMRTAMAVAAAGDTAGVVAENESKFQGGKAEPKDSDE